MIGWKRKNNRSSLAYQHFCPTHCKTSSYCELIPLIECKRPGFCIWKFDETSDILHAKKNLSDNCGKIIVKSWGKPLRVIVIDIWLQSKGLAKCISYRTKGLKKNDFKMIKPPCSLSYLLLSKTLKKLLFIAKVCRKRKYF